MKRKKRKNKPVLFELAKNVYAGVTAHWDLNQSQDQSVKNDFNRGNSKQTLNLLYFLGEHNILLDWEKVLGDQSYWDLGYDQRVRVMMIGDNFYKDPDNDYIDDSTMVRTTLLRLLGQ